MFIGFVWMEAQWIVDIICGNEKHLRKFSNEKRISQILWHITSQGVMFYHISYHIFSCCMVERSDFLLGYFNQMQNDIFMSLILRLCHKTPKGLPRLPILLAKIGTDFCFLIVYIEIVIDLCVITKKPLIKNVLCW